MMTPEKEMDPFSFEIKKKKQAHNTSRMVSKLVHRLQGLRIYTKAITVVGVP